MQGSRRHDITPDDNMVGNISSNILVNCIAGINMCIPT